MADLPLIAPNVPPPRPQIVPGAPLPPAPPVAGSPLFVPANGPRHRWLDAFYNDERVTMIPKAAHPVRSYYNIFTAFDGARSYDTARMLSAWREWWNPLRFPNLAKTLTQDFEVFKAFKRLGTSSDDTKRKFEDTAVYCIFVPPGVLYDFRAKPKRTKLKVRICLYFGVANEINLFGLRSFFRPARDCVLITLPAEKNWGIGITTGMIKELLEDAGVKDLEFTVEVMAGYSAGYRGLNETIINQLVSLKDLKRMVYLDDFYIHDDFPVSDGTHPFHRKNTLWAVETALTPSMGGSSGAELLIYAYTEGGVPRKDDERGPLAELQTKFGSRIRFIDLEFDATGKQITPNQVEKICLARMINAGLGDYFEEKDVALVSGDIMPLVKLLYDQPRGSFGVIGRPGFTNLFDWISAEPQKTAVARFRNDKAFHIVAKHMLLGDWTTPGHPYEFRHRDFVQEIGKECLLP